MKIPKNLAREAMQLAHDLRNKPLYCVQDSNNPVVYDRGSMEAVYAVSKEAVDAVKNAGLVVVASGGENLLEAAK